MPEAYYRFVTVLAFFQNIAGGEWRYGAILTDFSWAPNALQVGVSQKRGNSGQKNGVVWHNDAGEKDETVFNFFIGVRYLKSPVFLREKSGP